MDGDGDGDGICDTDDLGIPCPHLLPVGEARRPII